MTAQEFAAAVRVVPMEYAACRIAGVWKTYAPRAQEANGR